MAIVKDISFKTITESIKNGAADLLSNSDFISRTIGMNNSYEDIMFIVQSLGREPISLLGKDYAFIYDHVRRNYLQGTYVKSKLYGNNADGDCYKFTFYKEVPTVKFADPYNDPMNLLDRWIPDAKFETTAVHNDGGGTSIHYSESNDNYTNNKKIGYKGDLDSGNPGTATNSIYSFGPDLGTCDLIKKTNDNFNHGKYETLVARFHTNIEESKSSGNPTQTANSKKYGQSHGRNLLKVTPTEHNGYDNPYCRVWTYHHQYNQIARQIRPFDENINEETLESMELSGDYDTVGFRTSPSKNYGFDGGSKRLDKYGVLNYQNGTVNIAPTAKIKNYFEGKENDYDKQIIATKKCMFSLENLAWRDDKAVKSEFDAYGLSPEQRGPLGGRIMWFPPYDLTFNEDVTVKWNPNDFIGRGESIYTYTNTERRGSLSFTLVIDHPSILDYWTGHERNGMKNQGLHLDARNSGGVDNINNQENTLLRFFAGCDILTAVPQEYKVREVKPEEVPEPPEPKKPTPTEPDEAEPEHNKMYAILYYPNNYSGKDDDAEFAVNYLMYGVGTQKEIVHKEVSNEYVAQDFQPIVNADGAIGYEIKSGESGGISYKKWLEISDVDKYGATGDGVKEGVAEKINNYIYNNRPLYLAKQIGSKASKGKDVSGASSEWKYRRWYYRVDESTANQRLVDKANNYLDQESHQLNSIGYDWVVNNVKAFGLTSEDELVSFADLYCALTEGAEGLGANDENVRKIKKMLNEEDGYKITKLTFRGHNSSHGRNPSENVNVTRNKSLSSHRATTFKNWMSKMGFPMAAEADASKTVSETTQANTHKTDDVDNEYIKAWRSASVVIEYDKSNVSDAATAESVKQDVDRVEVKNKETSSGYLDFVRNLGNVKGNNGKTLAETTLEAYGEVDGKNYSDPNSWDYDDKYLKKGINLKQSTVKRYDNEGEFFEALTKDAPFLHNLITDKIRYFDPAYHAISPEGFNARLTFLHQCTRQGSTVEDSMGQGTAYNLAFGRPPVCVLRLGDFYYTKIVITGLNIQYENAQWDMNPEGIGMMPMFAKITINFNFLGGSDLAGPIARLQNAVSFNYYANTSVYDNRAEKVEYDPSGNGKEIKFKGFNYPNIYSGTRLNQNRIGEKDKQGGVYAEDF